MGFPEREERERKAERLFEEIMTVENMPISEKTWIYKYKKFNDFHIV